MTNPKWKIENKEIAKDTAIREICEEAGLLKRDLEVIKFITKLNYTFTAWHLEDHPLIDKDVYLFLIFALLALHGIVDDLMILPQYNSFWFVIAALFYKDRIDVQNRE